MTSDVTSKLNKLLNTTPKEPSEANPGSISHEHSGGIMQSLRGMLSQSKTGQELLDFADKTGVKMMVVKARQGFAAQPDPKTIYISAPAHMHDATPEMAISLVGALREAYQDTDPNWAKPNPALPLEQYKERFLSKKDDSLYIQCMVVDELTENIGENQFLDAFDKMGYSHIMKAYKEDLQK